MSTLLSLIPPSCIVASIRDQENINFSTLAIITSNMIMDLPGPVEMNIDDFNISNVDNYDNVRKYTMSSNKTASRMVSISSSKISVNYATRMEHLNNISDNEKTREPIDSSQLSYVEYRKIQVSGVTNHENRAKMQQDIENMPALKSTSIQCVDNVIINI